MAKDIKEKRPEGRPTIMDELTVKKLEDAYSNDATDEQACFLANISKQTLYNYQDKHPEFVDRKNALKDMIKYQAKLVIKQGLYDDKVKHDTARWYLERKDKASFSTRVEQTGADGKDLNPQPILSLNDLLSNNSDTTNSTAI